MKCEDLELVYLMEKEFPISFFDIQVHVLVHFMDWPCKCNEHSVDVLCREIHVHIEVRYSSNIIAKTNNGIGLTTKRMHACITSSSIWEVYT